MGTLLPVEGRGGYFIACLMKGWVLYCLFNEGVGTLLLV